MRKKRRTKESKGITLIALVVTLIVLLILAGISISMLTEQNGILNRASEAKENTEKQVVLEQINLAIMASMINSNAKVNGDILNNELNNYFGKNVIGNSQSGWTITSGTKIYTVSPTGEVEELKWKAQVTFSQNGSDVWMKSISTTIEVKEDNLNQASLKYLWSDRGDIQKEDFDIEGISFQNGETIINNGDETGEYYIWILAENNDGEISITKSNVFKLCNSIGYVLVWGWQEYVPNVYIKEQKKGLQYTLYVYNFDDDTLYATYDVTSPDWAEGMHSMRGSKFYYIVEDSLGNSQEAECLL